VKTARSPLGIGGLRFRAARVSKRIQLQPKTTRFLEVSTEQPEGCATSAGILAQANFDFRSSESPARAM
jgi:hypothetical protein